MTLEERVARLEALVQRLIPQGGPVDPLPSSPVGTPEEPTAGHDLGDLLNRFRRSGRRMVLSGVGHWAEGSHATATNSMIWDEGDRFELDHRRAAALCRALGSEARLAILCELLSAPRTTTDLTASTALERGQLYHHLRDLFVEGLVEQPERGRYQLTGRGEVVLLLTAALATAGPAESLTPLPEELAGGNPRP